MAARLPIPVNSPVNSPAKSLPSTTFDEAEARRVLLVQAFETNAADNPLWTAEDRAWASRLARQTVGADAGPAPFLADRASHALQRLGPRDPAALRWLARRGWRPAWLAAALSIGLLLGALADSLGSAQRINMLAPPVWGVIVWNLAVYLGLLLQVGRGLPARGLRRWAQRWLDGQGAGTPAVQSAALAWARHGAPLALARAGALLHVAAAALALGLMGGLYVRGLVLDIRAGWQSTFLDAGTVQPLMSALLAPARWLTGIELPDAAALAALRLQPGVEATASAAPWIHLYAAMLLIFVIVPRGLLAAVALWRARRGAARIELPLAEPYFQRLLFEQRGGAARVQVLPHAAAPGAQAALGLRAVLAQSFGETLELRVAAATAFGDEDETASLPTEPDTTLRVALFDLAATPEADSQGRFVRALLAARPVLPLLMVVDEAAFRRRFGALADRLAERRAGWRRLADELGCGLLCADLDQPDLATAEAALALALRHAPFTPTAEASR